MSNNYTYHAVRINCSLYARWHFKRTNVRIFNVAVHLRRYNFCPTWIENNKWWNIVARCARWPPPPPLSPPRRSGGSSNLMYLEPWFCALTRHLIYGVSRFYWDIYKNQNFMIRARSNVAIADVRYSLPFSTKSNKIYRNVREIENSTDIF